MERERLRADGGEQRAGDGEVARVVLLAAAHLDGDRHLDGIDDRLDHARGVLSAVRQHRRARARLGDLADGAAHVDVDDVGTGVGAHARSIGHQLRVGAEDLDGERLLIRGDAQVTLRARVAVTEATGRNHLRADEPCAMPATLAAEGLNGDAGHRCEHDSARDHHVADHPRVGQAAYINCHACRVSDARARPPLYHAACSTP